MALSSPGYDQAQALLGRASTRMRLGEPARVADDAAVLGRLGLLTEWRYTLAGLLAYCSGVAAVDGMRPLPLRERTCEAHATAAVRQLQLAERGGHFQSAEARRALDADPALDPLRGRADYRAWRDGLAPLGK